MINNVIRKPNTDDIEYMIENVRSEDLEELGAMGNGSIRDILEAVPDLSKNAEVWEVEGKVVCIFGVTPNIRIDGVGVIWMLATEEFDKFSRLFAVKCAKVVKKTLDGYEYVYNYVYSKNTNSIRWLEWLGFTIHDAQPIGKEGALFNRFDKINV